MTLIRQLEASEAEHRLPELAAILVDAVAHGASVNFMAGFTQADGIAFWTRQLPALQANTALLFVAEQNDTLIATVMLTFAPQPNGPHRADIGKMLVHSTARRQGLGRRLLATAEEAAHQHGRTLLLLDTESGSPGDRLYRQCGWTELCRIPGHSFTPDGRLADATLFYKTSGPPPAHAHM